MPHLLGKGWQLQSTCGKAISVSTSVLLLATHSHVGHPHALWPRDLAKCWAPTQPSGHVSGFLLLPSGPQEPSQSFSKPRPHCLQCPRKREGSLLLMPHHWLRWCPGSGAVGFTKEGSRSIFPTTGGNVAAAVSWLFTLQLFTLQTGNSRAVSLARRLRAEPEAQEDPQCPALPVTPSCWQEPRLLGCGLRFAWQGEMT